jgi:Zn-dependent protease
LPIALSLWHAKDYGVQVGIHVFVLVLLIFACVVGHEFSHSWVARRFGIEVPYITLYTMGGVASMERIPSIPKQEFLISIAGPLFNFVLAAVLFFPLKHIFGIQALMSPSLDEWSGVWANLLWANPILGLFNLIPAFPMDGGRIFRALLASKLSYLTATRISVFSGRFFAILFFLLGVWKQHWMLVLVAVYVFKSASDEWRSVSRAHGRT